jgi:6-phosphogluconolactonase
LQFPNLEIIRVKTSWEIGLGTARIIKALSPDGTVALSGGNTYKKMIEIWRGALGDARVRLFPVDERMVPFDSIESNWGMIQQGLLDPLDWPPSKRGFVERMSGAMVDDYNSLLKRVFLGPMPVFDVIFLGVGSDGHTASLFPGTPELEDETSWVLQTLSPQPPKGRVTLGMGVLCAARQVVIVVTGREKAPVVGKILRDREPLPIVRVLRHPVKKILFMDHDAAGPANSLDFEASGLMF